LIVVSSNIGPNRASLFKHFLPKKNEEIIIKNAMWQCKIKIDLSKLKDEAYSNFGVGS